MAVLAVPVNETKKWVQKSALLVRKETPKKAVMKEAWPSQEGEEEDTELNAACMPLWDGQPG